MEELLSTPEILTLLARQYDIGLNIDAEEVIVREISPIRWKTLRRTRTGGLERHWLCGSKGW